METPFFRRGNWGPEIEKVLTQGPTANLGGAVQPELAFRDLICPCLFQSNWINKH